MTNQTLFLCSHLLLFRPLLYVICCSAEAGTKWVSPQALCAELHVGSPGDLPGAPKMVVQLPGGGVAKRQPAGTALLLSPGNNSIPNAMNSAQNSVPVLYFLRLYTSWNCYNLLAVSAVFGSWNVTVLFHPLFLTTRLQCSVLRRLSVQWINPTVEFQETRYNDTLHWGTTFQKCVTFWNLDKKMIIF